MSCNCEEKKGFKESINMARGLEFNTGRKYAVWASGDGFTVGEVFLAKKLEHVCCYFLTDETKVDKPKVVSKKKIAKEEEVKEDLANDINYTNE